jgi:hypothetical protein
MYVSGLCHRLSQNVLDTALYLTIYAIFSNISHTSIFPLFTAHMQTHGRFTCIVISSRVLIYLDKYNCPV